MGFVVVDTEGKDIITEIAIIDESGKVILDEFVDNNLQDILLKAKDILQNNLIVAHYAKHDIEILKKSYASIGLSLNISSYCTYEHSKELVGGLESYSLEFLSKYLFLKNNDKFFDKNLAHRASYDAIFTYLLYNQLQKRYLSQKNAKNINPFSSSKVDNPFQNHFDDDSLYRDEFDILLGSLYDIKNDQNHQSKSAVVLAKAGDGKTHLMMRFVQRVSKTNRFLFIGKPNDKDAIFLHIYTKILESFIQKIDNSKYSQLEYLLAKSFSKIIIKTSSNKRIKEILEKDPLNIYKKFGGKNRDRNWRSIERSMLKWYSQEVGGDLVTKEILKALVRYTFYIDEERKGLVISYLSGKDLDDSELERIGLEARSEDFNKEAFSLLAISLFGKLSIFDEPLIISFDQLEAMSGDDKLVESFVEGVKEIITQTPNTLIVLNLFPNRWSEYEAIFDGSIIDLLGRTKIYLERPASSVIRSMLIGRAKACGVDLEYIFSSKVYTDIMKHNSIRKVLNRANEHYQSIVHNIALPQIKEPSLEDRLLELLARVEHLESINKIVVPKIEKRVDFNIEDYINKVYKSKSLSYQKLSIVDDTNDIGKLKFILETIGEIYDFEIDFFKMSKVIPEHIKVTTDRYTYVIGFLHISGRPFVNRIKNFNQLVVNYPKLYFRLFRDIRETAINGEVSKKEIEKLKNSQNGDFLDIDSEGRIIYESIYQLVIDYKNRDVEVELEPLMEGISMKFRDFWLCRLING
jgi:hypothetical protein